MNRNVQRVGVGVGAFHNPPRAKYSEETRDLIKRESPIIFLVNLRDNNFIKIPRRSRKRLKILFQPELCLK